MRGGVAVQWLYALRSGVRFINELCERYKRAMREREDKADPASVRYWLRTTSDAGESLPGLGALCVEVLGKVLNHRWLDASAHGLQLGHRGYL